MMRIYLAILAILAGNMACYAINITGDTGWGRTANWTDSAANDKRVSAEAFDQEFDAIRDWSYNHTASPEFQGEFAHNRDFGKDSSVIVGAMWAWKEGRIRNRNVVSTISSGTVVLADSTTYFFQVNPDTNGLLFTTTGFAVGNLPIWEIHISLGVVNDDTDVRAFMAYDGDTNLTQEQLILAERSEPANPGTGFGTLYIDQSDNSLRLKSDSGVVTTFGIPKGIISMWSGAVTAIPSGWALCNGDSYSTLDGDSIQSPDLRGMFIVGAGGVGSVSGDSYNVGQTGGDSAVTLATAEMPVHGHGVTDGGHTHLITQSAAGGAFGSAREGSLSASPPDGTSSASSTTGITIDNTGGGGSHENRPDFYALAFIIKL